MTSSFELQGHRGARGLFPENTLAGFAAAIALGVDTIELDVGVTKDGVTVVTHDAELNPDLTRTPDGAWLACTGPAIRTLTRAELRRYDVGRLRPGSGYAALFPAQIPQDGARIPTLADVFAATASTPVDVELKTRADRSDLTVPPEEMAERAVAVAAAAGALARLTVRAFDWRGLRYLRRVRPGVPLVWLTRAETVARAPLWWGGPTPADFGGSVPRAVAAEGGRGAWAPAFSTLTADLVAEAHTLGLRVLPWTVNAPDMMARLLDWGVDGFCTDRPDLAIALKASGKEGVLF